MFPLLICQALELIFQNLDYNNIVYNKPDLTIYAIKSDVDDSLNIINNTLTIKKKYQLVHH